MTAKDVDQYILFEAKIRENRKKIRALEEEETRMKATMNKLLPQKPSNNYRVFLASDGLTYLHIKYGDVPSSGNVTVNQIDNDHSYGRIFSTGAELD